jgi:hypothetical protein
MKAKKLLLLAQLFLVFTMFAQQEYGNYDTYSAYDLDYMNSGDFTDLRLRKAGDKAISLMYFIPFDYNNQGGIEVDTNFEISTQHRITERFVPNYKIYLNNKTNLNIGLFYRRISESLSGEIDTALTPGPVLSQKEKTTGQGIYFRLGFDRHLYLQRFKQFDFDLYAGAALTAGFIPQKEVDQIDFINDDYQYSTRKSNSMGFGVDAYTGFNFQINRISVGAELIFFGLDINQGFGKTKVSNESSIGGVVTTEEFSTSDTDPLTQYSKLNINKNQASMYRGLRLTVAYYF